MKKIYFIILFQILCSFLNASTKIDSLFLKINDPNINDTLKAQLYLEYAENIAYRSMDTLCLFSQRSYEICENGFKTNINEREINSLRVSWINALINQGYCKHTIGLYSNAIDNYKKAIEWGIKLKVNDALSSAYNNIALSYKDIGDIEKALFYWNNTLTIREKLGYKKGIANVLNNLAYVYNHQNEMDSALKYYNRSLHIRNEIDDKRGIAESLTNIGYIYESNNKLDTALNYYRKALAIREEIKDERGIANSNNNIGVVMKAKGNYAEALVHYKIAYETYHKANNKKEMANVLNVIGHLYYETNDIDNALDYCTKSYALSKEIGSPEKIKSAAFNLYEINKHLNKNKEALSFFEDYITMRDSIQNEKTEKATIRQQTKYEFEKEQLIKEQKEKEELRTQKEALNRRNNLQYSIILVSILFVFGVILSLGKINISPRFAEGLIFFAFLIFFEFCLVLLDPYVDQYSGGEPAYKLLFNAVLAAAIFPAHAFFESYLKNRILIKDKK